MQILTSCFGSRGSKVRILSLRPDIIRHYRIFDGDALFLCDAGATQRPFDYSESTSLSTPYAHFFLPCILAGAPAYPSIQRQAVRSAAAHRMGTQTFAHCEPSENLYSLRWSSVAGASFFAGAASVQGGRLPPLPAPLFQERQGKRSWPTTRPVVFHGSFCALWSRGRNGRPRCQGFFGFSAVGIWEENGAITVLVAVVTVAVQVLEARHG